MHQYAPVWKNYIQDEIYLCFSNRRFYLSRQFLTIAQRTMADEKKLLTILSPLTSDSLDLSPTNCSSVWADTTSQMFLNSESTTMWPQDPAFYSFAPNETAALHAMHNFDANGHSLNQIESCSSQSTSARSGSWPASSASTPRAETDIRTSRRRAQNRIAQRTYRARKENAIKEHEQRSSELEKELSDLKTSNAKLEFGVQCLKGQVVELQQCVRRHTSGKSQYYNRLIVLQVTWWRKIAYESRSGSNSPVLDSAHMMKQERQRP